MINILMAFFTVYIKSVIENVVTIYKTQEVRTPIKINTVRL